MNNDKVRVISDSVHQCVRDCCIRYSIYTAGCATLALAIELPAHAQTKVVSVCSGVSLPPSVITGILDPVLTGAIQPIEDTTNAILGLPLIGGVLPGLNVDIAGLLATAAAGDNITLQAIALDGTLVGPTDDCQASAQSYSLDTAAGISIGGNQITGLGANGATASAAEITSLAIGDNALTAVGADNAVALGWGATVSASGSVAIGANSVADRAGSVSFGSAGSERLLTNVAAGVEATDAANYGQVLAVEADLAVLSGLSVNYADATGAQVQLAGASGTVIANLADGTLSAASTEAVNGSQLFDTNQQVAAGAAANVVNSQNISDNSVAITQNSDAITTVGAQVGLLEQNAVQYDDGTKGQLTLLGASGTLVTNVADGTLSAASTDAVNGSQLFDTNQAVGANRASMLANSASIGDNRASITVLETDLGVLNDSAVFYSDGARTSISLAGADGTRIDNLADGALSASSTEAVNGSQLFATNQAVAGNGAAIAVNVQNIADNSVAITQNSDAITNINTQVGTLNADAVQYDDGSQATLTLAGADGTVVANVADGALSETSTEAVNGSQLFATNQAVAGNGTAIADNRVSIDANQQSISTLAIDFSALNDNALVYDDAGKSLVTLAGAGGTRISNVAAADVSATSTDAVNGGQLFATNQRVAGNGAAIAVNVQNIADNSVAITQNSDAITNINTQVGTLNADAVQYDDGSQATLTLAGADGTVVANVADGALSETSTEAVNGSQLYATNQAVSANQGRSPPMARISRSTARRSRATAPTLPAYPPRSPPSARMPFSMMTAARQP